MCGLDSEKLATTKISNWGFHNSPGASGLKFSCTWATWNAESREPLVLVATLRTSPAQTHLEAVRMGLGFASHLSLLFPEPENVAPPPWGSLPLFMFALVIIIYLFIYYLCTGGYIYSGGQGDIGAGLAQTFSVKTEAVVPWPLCLLCKWFYLSD